MPSATPGKLIIACESKSIAVYNEDGDEVLQSAISGGGGGGEVGIEHGRLDLEYLCD